MITGTIASTFTLFSGTTSVQDVVKTEFASLKTFITEGLEEQKEYTKHLIELSQLDELIRISQSVLDELTLKIQFLNVFFNKDLSSTVSAQIRDEMNVLSQTSQISLFRITYDDMCNR